MPRSGPFRELAQLADRLGVRNRVKFAGEVAAGGAAGTAAVGRHHGQRLAVRAERAAAIQAMACGTPAVVSAVGGHWTP